MKRCTGQVQPSHPSVIVNKLGRGTRRADARRMWREDGVAVLGSLDFLKVARMRETAAIQCETVHGHSKLPRASISKQKSLIYLVTFRSGCRVEVNSIYRTPFGL